MVDQEPTAYLGGPRTDGLDRPVGSGAAEMRQSGRYPNGQAGVECLVVSEEELDEACRLGLDQGARKRSTTPVGGPACV